MDKELEEENKPKMHKFILTNPDWLDLPEPIATNTILEHLEIVDYIRFSAVCRKWHSIQKEHRIRYSPHPPPLPLPFPWLRCIRSKFKDDGSILFHLPDKQKSYTIPFPKKIQRVFRTDYGHGFLILFLIETNVFYQSVACIFNPITAVLIKLPQCSDGDVNFYTGCISSLPIDPDCTILIEDLDGIFYFYRLNKDSDWKKIDRLKSIGSSGVFCNNKIYLLRPNGHFCIIDTLLADPIEQMIEMNCSEINVVGLLLNQYDLVNFFGEVVMVSTVHEDSVEHDYNTIKEFQVHKADFLTHKWTRMETLGDRVLFYSPCSIFALSAIDVGCKKNTIYSAGGLKGRGVAWRAFDVSSRDWIDGPPLSLSSNECYLNSSWSWFLPTL